MGYSGGVRGLHAAPLTATQHSLPMTTTERVEALWQLYQQLDALTTPDEIEVYPFLSHLSDLIEDLEMEED